jgi:GNAT superfamily N-acetyltransferase
MALEIAEVQSKRDMKKFMLFPMQLYAGSPYYVPPLIHEEIGVFSPKNPVFENAEAKLFLARRDGRIVGRLAAIISHIANEKFNAKNMRFGWFDFIDDYAVAEALLKKAEDWGRTRGMRTITGPQGFNDFDKWGMLIEGYDTIPTFSSYYNHPYYVEFIERYGFVKEADAFEYRIKNLQTNPFSPRMIEMAERIRKRKGLSVLHFRNRKEMSARAGEIFDLLEEAYADLYGVVPLTPNQRAYYIEKYFPVLVPDLAKVVVNSENKIIGVVVAMPNLSTALRKANGRLFPFGIVHMLLAMRKPKLVDFVLAGVRKGYRGRGIDLIMGVELYTTLKKWGFEEGESNPELEANEAVRAEWQIIEHVQTRRRRIYKKDIEKHTP